MFAAVLAVLVVASQVVALVDEPSRLLITSVVTMLLDVLGVGYGIRAARRDTNRFTWPAMTAAAPCRSSPPSS